MQQSIGRLRQDSAGSLPVDNSLLPLPGGSLKRALDVTVASVALVALIPLIILTAVVVRLLTRETTIRSERLIGRGGKIFVGYTFRLPGENGPWTGCVAEALRESGLVQLPRLFNLIRGDMSLIGPRPRAESECRDYFDQAPECLRVRPGLISIGQGKALDQRTEIVVERCYVRNWSLRLDFALLSMSAISVWSAHVDKTV